MHHVGCAFISSLFFATLIPRFFYNIQMQNTSHTHFTPFQLYLFVEFTLIPSHLAHPSLQFVAENLQSCTVGLLLFDWDFLIHTFSLLTAPAAKQYQEEQAICARHKLLSSLPFPLKANRWNCSYALRQLTQSAFMSYYAGHTHVQSNMFACKMYWCGLQRKKRQYFGISHCSISLDITHPQSLGFNCRFDSVIIVCRSQPEGKTATTINGLKINCKFLRTILS